MGWADYRERLRGQADAVVDEGKLPPKLGVPGVQGQAQLRKRPALLRAEHAALPRGAGQALVRGAEDDEVLYVPAAHPVHVARRDHIQRDGDDAHVILREREQIEPREARGVQLHVAQDGGALFKRGDRRVPEPGMLVRGLEASRGLQLVGTCGKALREVQVLEKLRQGQGLFPGAAGLAAGVFERQERRCGPAAQVVYPREALSRDLVELPLPAIRVHAPIPLREPLGAADVPGEAIVFQLVALVRIEAGEARAQICEDVLLLPAAADTFIGCGYERRQGLLRYVRLPRGEKRHAVIGEGRLQLRAVVLKRADGHGDVPPAAAGAREFYGPRGGQLALGGRALGGVQLHAARGVKARLGVA